MVGGWWLAVSELDLEVSGQRVRQLLNKGEKMKKTIILLFTILMVVLAFTSCNNDGVPSGMKLASNPSKSGFTLYVPESWIIDGMDYTSSAHASDSDRTSISVKKSNFTSIDEWWTSYKDAISTSFNDLKLDVEGEDYVLATLNAKRYAFTASFNNSSYYKYEIIATSKDGFVYELLIKYQGAKKDDTITYTDTAHAKNIKKIIDNFSINDTESIQSEVSFEAENTPENMKCASNAKIVDYYLFVPNSWVIENTSGTVSSAYVSEDDKTSISVMQWNFRGNFDSWWNEYLLQLYSTFDYNSIPLNEKGEAIADENGKIQFLESDVITVNSQATDIKIDNTDAKKYTYSLKTRENVYDFDIYAIITRGSVYVITFTFLDGCDMSLYTSDIDKILNSFRFI